MKIRLFLTLLIISVIPALKAQNNFKSENYIGVNAGPVFSMVFFKPTVNQYYLMGYQTGLVFRHINEKSLGIQVEVNYSQRGWNEFNGQYARRLDYIEMPFLSHIYFGNKVRFFFNLGPKISYLIDDVVVRNTVETSSEQHELAAENKLDYGFAAGMGLMFMIGRQAFQLDTRANYSVSNFFPDSRIDYFDNSNHMNASATLSWLLKL